MEEEAPQFLHRCLVLEFVIAARRKKMARKIFDTLKFFKGIMNIEY